MKQLLSLSLFLIATSLFAQNYLDNDPQWRQEYFFGGNGSCIENQQYVYELSGDSVVNDITYKKVIKHGTKTFNWMDAPPAPPGCDTSFAFSEFSALVREEAKKIYTCTPGGQDTLLYDFDLEAGDYLPLTWNQNVEEVMVLAVDSILVNGSYHKIFELEEFYGQPNNLIEGIGFESGFLESFSSWEFPASLQCFAKDGTTFYPNHNAPCNLSVNIAVLTPDKKTLIAYPNPVADILTIETDNRSEIANVSAFDTMGKSTLLRIDKSGKKIQLDCSELNNGVHFIRISYRNGESKDLKILKK